MLRGIDYLTEGFDRKDEIKIFKFEEIEELEEYVGGGFKVGHSRRTASYDIELSDEELFMIKNLRRYEWDAYNLG